MIKNQSKMGNKEIGKRGEEIAASYLLANEYLILAKNHKERFDEIDIIARHQNGTLVFCEVKSINVDFLDPTGQSSFFMPEDNLSGKKLMKIRRAVKSFLAYHPTLEKGDAGWQIDLIAVVLQRGKPAYLRHYKNI